MLTAMHVLRHTDYWRFLSSVGHDEPVTKSVDEIAICSSHTIKSLIKATLIITICRGALFRVVPLN